MLLEPRPVVLDRRQREEVADLAHQLGERLVVDRLELADECLEDLALDVGPRRRDHVVLALVEDVEGLLARVDPALEPAGDAGDHVLLPPAQEAELVIAVEQVVLVLAARDEIVGESLDDLPDRGPLDHRLVHLAGDEADRADRVELAELVAVVGQESLGDELEEDRVVAFEGGEDVGVRPELSEPVLAQVARAAAALAAGLDRLDRVPCGEGLDPGGARLELAALLLRVVVRRRRRSSSSAISSCWAK